MKSFLFVLLSAFVFVNAYTQSDVATARWATQPVIIDGENTEWGSLNFYDDDTRLSFGIANDSNNIYLCFESTEEPDQMKLMRAGMKVSLSTKGKPKHDATIVFPLPQNKPEQPQTQPAINMANKMPYSNAVHDASSFRKNFFLNHRVMSISGFASANGELPVDSMPGVRAAINWDSTSNLFYEIAIAKKEFFGTDYSAKDAAEDITLNVEINALPHSSNEGTNTSGGYHGGNYGMSGGGMHGGGMHGNHQFNNSENGSNEESNTEDADRQSNQAARAALGVKTSFKQKFVLNDNSSKENN